MRGGATVARQAHALEVAGSTPAPATIQFRIVAPHFVAGGTAENGKVLGGRRIAPIIRWMAGKDWSKMKGYCKRKGWQVEEIHED